MGNSLTHVGLTRVVPNMVYAGLGYNHLASPTQLRSLVECFPRLRILDLSFNAICDLAGTLECLAKLPQLSHLSLMGNPLTLLENYRSHVVRALPKVMELDDLSTEGHFKMVHELAADAEVPSAVFLCFDVSEVTFSDAGVNSGKKDNKKAKTDKKDAKGKGKGKKDPKGKGKKAKKGKKTKKTQSEPVAVDAEPKPVERQTLFYIEVSVPGVDGAVAKTAAIPMADDGQLSFPQPAVVQVLPSADLRDCLYFGGVSVSLFSYTSTPQSPAPLLSAGIESEATPPTDGDALDPILSTPRSEGMYELQLKVFLDPVWKLEQMSNKPAAVPEDVSAPDENVSSATPGNPLFVLKTVNLVRPAAVMGSGGNGDGETTLHGAPPGPISMRIRAQLNKSPPAPIDVNVGADAGD